MRNRISPVPTSIVALTSFGKGRPRMSYTPKSPSMSRTMKSARMKEFLTHTSMFSTIPSRCQTVESTSYMSIRVWVRTGYHSCSMIIWGMMFMLAPRS